MSLKYHFQQKCWLEWDEDLRFRKRKALDFYRKELMGDLEFWKVCQFLFYKQWHELKVYANKRGVQLIGDIPLYVSLDSVDVWANASLFLLGSDRRPTCVAGVPPDCFSEEGQLWGNPIYNWRKMHLSNFSWWRKRMRANAELYDVIRVDHFIGIVRYYSIPAGEANAKKGKWCKGPGKRLTREIEAAIGEASIIAEDLGVITEEVRALMHEMNWPGMKVLEFAFSGEPQNEYLPHNYKSPNCVLYGGTHDNDTLLGFIKSVTPEQRAQLLNYINVDEEDSLLHSIIKVGYASIARTAIFQMQDILALGTEARMNEPSTVGTNWVWRMSCNQLKEKDAKWLSDQVDTYGRH